MNTANSTTDATDATTTKGRFVIPEGKEGEAYALLVHLLIAKKNGATASNAEQLTEDEAMALTEAWHKSDDFKPLENLLIYHGAGWHYVAEDTGQTQAEILADIAKHFGMEAAMEARGGKVGAIPTA